MPTLCPQIKLDDSKSSCFNCRKRKLDKPIGEMDKNKPGQCARDTLSYKSISDRWAKNRQLRVWFQNMSPQEQIDWYRKQQGVAAGKKRRFDEVTYADSTETSTGNEKKKRYHMMPWWLFYHYKHTAGQSDVSIAQEWKDAIEGKGAEAEYEDGQWCVSMFMGVFKDTVDSNLQVSRTQRQVQVQNADQLDELLRAGQSMRNSFSAQYRAPRALGDGTSAPVVDASPAEMPQSVQMADITMGAIQRELNSKHRDDAQIMKAEIEDASAAALCEAPGGTGAKAGRAGDLNIGCMRLDSSIAIAIQKGKTYIDKVGADEKEVTDLLLGLGGDEKFTSIVGTLLQNVAQDKAASIAHINQHTTALTKLRERLPQAQTSAGLQSCREEQTKLTKELDKGPLKDYKVGVVMFHSGNILPRADDLRKHINININT